MRTRSRRAAEFFRQWSYLVIRAQQPCFDMPESGKLDSRLGYLRSWLNLCRALRKVLKRKLHPATHLGF